MNDMRRSIRLFLLGCAIAATAGCLPAPPPEDSGPSLPDPRREQFRDELRGRLGDEYDAQVAEGNIEQIRHGSKLYDTLCRACHGPTGKGNGRSARLLEIRPQDLSDPRTASFFSNRAKLQIIAEGIAGTPMIGWERMLREEEQLAVLQFMNSLIKQPEAP